jgi:AsmA protein
MVRGLTIAIAVVIVLVIGAAAAVPYVVDTPRGRAFVSHAASQALGRPVKFSTFSVTLLPMPALRLQDLQVAEDPRFGTAPFLTMAAGSFRLRLLPLLTGRMEFSELVLERPRVSLVRDAEGRMNVGSLGTPLASAGTPGRATAPRTGASAPPVPVVSRVRIVNGILRYASATADGRTSAYQLRNLQLTIAGIGLASPIQFTGEGTLDPGGASLRIQDGIVAILGARSVLDAPVKARLLLEGKDVSDLAQQTIGSSPTLAGPFKGTLALAGSVGAPLVSGAIELTRFSVTAERPRCPAPRHRTLTLQDVSVPVSFESDRLASLPFTTKLASGTISAGLTVTFAGGNVIRARDVGIRNLPLAPVLVDYLCEPYAVTGPLDLSGDLSARPSDFVRTLSGTGRFKIGPGKVVGPQALKLLERTLRTGGLVASLAAADLPAALFDRPLDFESITASYAIQNGVVRTTDLRYTSRAFSLSAAGRYGLADGSLNLDVLMKTGRGEVAARVTGTTDAPSIRIDPSSAMPYRRGVDRGLREVEQGVRDLLRRLR